VSSLRDLDRRFLGSSHHGRQARGENSVGEGPDPERSIRDGLCARGATRSLRGGNLSVPGPEPKNGRSLRIRDPPASALPISKPSHDLKTARGLAGHRGANRAKIPAAKPGSPLTSSYNPGTGAKNSKSLTAAISCPDRRVRPFLRKLALGRGSEFAGVHSAANMPPSSRSATGLATPSGGFGKARSASGPCEPPSKSTRGRKIGVHLPVPVDRAPLPRK